MPDFTVQQLPRTQSPPSSFDIMFADGADNYYKGDTVAVKAWLGELDPGEPGSIPGLEQVTLVNGYTPHPVSIGTPIVPQYKFQVVGATRLDGAATIEQGARVNGKFSVKGAADQAYDARIYGTGLKVDGVLDVGGNGGVTGSLEVGANINAVGNITGVAAQFATGMFSGNVDIGGNLVVDQTLAVTGESDFLQHVDLFSSLDVGGNVQLLGPNLTISANQPKFNGDTILIDANQTGAPASGNRGIVVERGTLTNQALYWDEINDDWRVGVLGSGKRLAQLSSTAIDGKFLRWNATTKEIETADLPDLGGGGVVITGTPNRVAVFNAAGDNVENTIIEEIGGTLIDILGHLTVDNNITAGGSLQANSGNINTSLVVGGLLDVNANADISSTLNVGGATTLAALTMSGNFTATGKLTATNAAVTVASDDFIVNSDDMFINSSTFTADAKFLQLNNAQSGAPTGVQSGLEIAGGSQFNKRLLFDFNAGYWMVGENGVFQRLVPLADNAEDGKFLKFDSNNKRYFTADIPAVEGTVISGTPNTVAMFNLDGDNVTGSIMTQPTSGQIRINGRLRIDNRTGSVVQLLGRDSNGFVVDAGNITDFVSKANGGDFMNAIGVDEATAPNFDLKVSGNMRGTFSATNVNGNGRVVVGNNGTGVRAVSILMSPNFGAGDVPGITDGGGTFIGGVNGICTVAPGQNSNGGLIGTGSAFWKWGSVSNVSDLTVSRVFEVQVNGTVYQIYGRVKP